MDNVKIAEELVKLAKELKADNMSSVRFFEKQGKKIGVSVMGKVIDRMRDDAVTFLDENDNMTESEAVEIMFKVFLDYVQAVAFDEKINLK